MLQQTIQAAVDPQQWPPAERAEPQKCQQGLVKEPTITLNLSKQAGTAASQQVSTPLLCS
jgi:hypothetical protein